MEFIIRSTECEFLPLPSLREYFLLIKGLGSRRRRGRGKRKNGGGGGGDLVING